MIPKVIYQTHEYEYKDLPGFMKEQSATWISLNEEYQYVYYNKDERRDYIKQYLPEIVDAYDNISNHFKADIWRYLILYNNGGFYADMDSICISPIDNVLHYKYVDHEVVAINIISPAPHGSMATKTQYVNNSNFGCIKGSKIIKDVLEKTVEIATNNPKMLGPGIYSDVVVDNKELVLFELNLCALHDGNFKKDNGFDFKGLKDPNTRNLTVYQVIKNIERINSLKI